MLKTMGMHKLVAPAIALMLGIGVVLTGIGFAMERNTEYLKEDGNHKWYQIVYIDQNGWFRFLVIWFLLVVLGFQMHQMHQQCHKLQVHLLHLSDI